MIKTKPEEFEKFNKLLTEKAPDGYIPWYFPVTMNDKHPDGLTISNRAGKLCICGGSWIYDKESKKNICDKCKTAKGSWKSDYARLNYEEALERLKYGSNVGIAARENDKLIIIDIDSYDYLVNAPISLAVKSRKRFGLHIFCWWGDEIDKINIPTNFGEIRASEQYVVAAGSYVTTDKLNIDKEDIPEDIKNNIKNDIDLGVYTLDNPINPKMIVYNEIPAVFRQQNNIVISEENGEFDENKFILPKKHSKLFDLKIIDVVEKPTKERFSHPLHVSETGSNFSISEHKNLATCWRHNVTLNPIQFLVVKSGYIDCLNAGTGTKNSGAGKSKIINNDGAIFYAWIQAKKDNIIPVDDPIPIKAMRYIAIKHNLITNKEYTDDDWRLPVKIYNNVLEIVRNKY